MSQELIDLLVKYDVQVPRYTSYPTAPEWGELAATTYQEKLASIGQNELALYLHIPFCRTMCLFCACSVVLNRRPENEVRYVDYLCKEIDLVTRYLGKGKKVSQLHFGGGTPTKISSELFLQLYEKIGTSFDLTKDAEIAIEIDPRTVYEDQGEKLKMLKELGFTRVSFGVQDTNEKVQEAIKRRQSLETTIYTFELARKLGFTGINIDLIYGLPLQTEASFIDTIETILALRPDRLALFSFAYVPWMKGHQKAIKTSQLPTTSEKFAMYAHARTALINSGYKAIGMDHFAIAHDEMATAYEKKRLQRNFQGYTVLPVDDLIGLGVTSIGFLQNCYVQNVKELADYYGCLDRGELAAFRGKELTSEDLIRRYVIQRLMCDFALDKEQFFTRFGILFDSYFEQEKCALEPYILQGFVEDSSSKLQVTKQGELFIRNITSTFDWYLAQKTAHKSFSKAI